MKEQPELNPSEILFLDWLNETEMKWAKALRDHLRCRVCGATSDNPFVLLFLGRWNTSECLCSACNNWLVETLAAGEY